MISIQKIHPIFQVEAHCGEEFEFSADERRRKRVIKKHTNDTITFILQKAVKTTARYSGCKQRVATIRLWPHSSFRHGLLDCPHWQVRQSKIFSGYSEFRKHVCNGNSSCKIRIEDRDRKTSAETLGSCLKHMIDILNSAIKVPLFSSFGSSRWLWHRNEI